MVKKRSEAEAWSLVVDHEADITKYARFIARRLRVPSVEDAEQEARLAAFWAAMRYDTSKGTMFMTWARYWIWLHVRRALLKPLVSGDNKIRKGIVVLPMETLDSEEWSSAQILLPDDPVLVRERENLVKEIVVRMSSWMRAVAVRCILRDESLTEVGHEFGVTCEWVRITRNQALNRIQWELWDKGALDFEPESEVSSPHA